MNTREEILTRLRVACPAAGSTTRELRSIVPARSVKIERGALIDHFVTQAREAGCEVQVVGAEQDLVESIRCLSREHRPDVPDRRLQTRFPFIDSCGDHGPCTLVQADAAIAETGSVCIDSRHVASRSLFLCDRLWVLLEAGDILRYQEDYWCAIHSAVSRATHLVTGPSRTADVEQTIQIGAHGPRTLAILLYTGA